MKGVQHRKTYKRKIFLDKDVKNLFDECGVFWPERGPEGYLQQCDVRSQNTRRNQPTYENDRLLPVLLESIVEEELDLSLTGISFFVNFSILQLTALVVRLEFELAGIEVESLGERSSEGGRELLVDAGTKGV